MVKKFPLSNFKLWLFISALFTFSNAFSANWYVNDNSTTGDVYCTAIGNNTNNGTSPSTPKLTLKAALDACAAGDTIFIDTGTYSGTGNINLTVSTANITFTGAGSLKTIFDNNLASANSNLWLTINANNINISGISATEFNAISAGKVVTVNGQTVTFNDVIFFNNGNQGNGAIYITSNSNVTYSNSSTTCNASLLFGGGIDLVGNNSVLNITNCIIATNKKEDNGDGGGVLVKGNGNNVTITNTRFEKNDAVNGGAICIMGGTSAAPNLVTITGSCFENNKVSQVSSVVNGSAICIGRGGSTVNVTDCSFTNNLAGTAASQTGNGGAISVNTGIVGGLSGLSGTATLNLLRCNFSGNNATSSGKHIYGDVVTGPAAVNINQCTFASAGNFDIAQKTAGEIAFTVTNSGTPTVSNLTLTNSTAPTQTAATVCQTFTGNGCTLPAPCTASLSYPNSSICSSASTQTPTFSPTGGTFTSTTGLSINALTGVITPSSSTAGTYTVTYTPNSADPTCKATFSITIVAAPNAGTNGTLTICAGSIVTAAQLFAQLGGSPASGGTWTPTLAGAGTYTYSVAAISPCTTAATATVTVTEQTQPNAGTNGTLTICAGTTVTATQLFAQLGGSPSTGGAWSPTLAGAGTYTYSVSATSPCTTAATATVTVSDSQPAQPTTACYQTATFNTTTCSWDVTGIQPTQPTATNCWDDYQFNTTSCTWVNNGSQPAQPTATNCWDNYQFNTTLCTWVNNGSQPTHPTATNCWDNYQFNTTSCSWDNAGSQPSQPAATNCWDNYQFNTTSCSWVNNGTQPAQPADTNCWENYQFNTTSCSWVNNGSQPAQPAVTNCWDNYQFNTTSCTWDNAGSQPSQPAIACYQTTTFNTTTCSWDVTGTQQPAPLITVNNAVCTGSTYSVEFNSNGTIVASSGTINGNTVNGIAVGTDLTLTATSSNGCATSSISIISPTNCLTPRGCVNPILSAGQGSCYGTGTYSFAFNVSQNANISTSAGTVSGNTVINIPIGTTVTLTATDGLCSTSIQVTSPLDCSTPCGSPLASFSAGICNGDIYSISISNPNGAIITSSLGIVTTTAITGIPTGASVTVTSSLSGCISQQITILSPIKIAPMLVVSNPICNGNTYSVTYSSNGSIDISSGSLGSESITGIPVGTDLLIIASSLNGCASTTMTVKSPLNCANPPTDCVMPTLSAGQGTCAGTGTYSFAFNASVGAVVTVSSGTISGNAVTGIALGTNVTLTATNGSCVTSLVVNSPTDCSTPCATPVVSFSAGICNGTTYSINISNPNNATITTSAGIVTATAITGISIGTSVTITSSISGCSPQIITISSPLIPVNPNAGNDGSIEICDGDVPTNAELFAALGGNPQLGGSWSNSGNIYTYTVMAASSCASLPLDRATVTVSTIIINDFEIVGHCNDSRYQLTINPVQSDAVYTWYNGIGDLIGTGNSMYINASDTYEVTSSKSICSKIKSIYIEDIHCIIPKGVSPNGDGLNDTWDLSNMNVEKAQIFNRYGMEMYSKSNYTDEWHGQTDGGQMLPSATYYYVLRFLDGTTKTGWVYLNREQ